MSTWAITQSMIILYITILPSFSQESRTLVICLAPFQWLVWWEHSSHGCRDQTLATVHWMCWYLIFFCPPIMSGKRSLLHTPMFHILHTYLKVEVCQNFDIHFMANDRSCQWWILQVCFRHGNGWKFKRGGHNFVSCIFHRSTLFNYCLWSMYIHNTPILCIYNQLQNSSTIQMDISLSFWLTYTTKNNLDLLQCCQTNHKSTICRQGPCLC